MQSRPNGTTKDTVVNIRRTGEFVVHMVDIAIAEQMIVTGINFPSDVDEISFAGLTALPSVKVLPPRIAESPCAMECVVEQTIDYETRSIVLGRVVHMHVRDECLDADGHYVVPEKYLPIARLHADNYIVADRQFELKKPAHLLHHEAASGYAEPAPVKAAE
jgi:flavin reductase (DIM6/NTAB) family NADH-FMN oxidoreductase RutF